MSPGSCNNGFKSLPSIGMDKFLSNGLDVKIRNAKNPRFNTPIIDKNFNLKSKSKLLLYMLAKKVQKLNTKHQSNIDPSCPAQVADIL